MKRPAVMRKGTHVYIRDSGEILAGNGSDVESFDEMAKALHHLSLDGTDEEAGSVSEDGLWIGLLLDVTVQYEDENYLAEVQHFVITVDEQGFKHSEQFSSQEVASKHFYSLAADLERDDDDDDDDDDDGEDDGFPDYDEDDLPDYDE